MTSSAAETPTVTLKLNLKERIVTGSVIGSIKQASFADWGIIEEFMNVISLKSADYEEFGIESNEATGIVTWKNKEKADEEREYKVTPASYELFKKKLQELNQKNGLNKDQSAVAKKLNIFS